MASGRQLTHEEFIKKSSVKHNWKYDYSKTVYTKAKEKVCIICPVHGEFWQKADKHMNEGCGCPKCSKTFQYTTESFIEAARKVHGDLYDYSKVEYVNNRTKVCIIDKQAGEFWQLPSNHLNGNKCYLTQGERIWNTRGRISTEEFIKRAKDIHGGNYDYSLVDYKGINIKVDIICKKCGRKFKQTPNNHLNQKNGCPFCSQSKLEVEIDNLLRSNDISFEKQKRFPWLGRQSLDFYLPEYNIGIECQGIQHYESVEQYGGEKRLSNQIKADEKKYRLCTENGVKIVYYTKYKVNGRNIAKNNKELINKITYGF